MNPNYENLQRLLSMMTPFIASGFFSGGSGQGSAAGSDGKEM